MKTERPRTEISISILTEVLINLDRYAQAHGRSRSRMNERFLIEAMGLTHLNELPPRKDKS